MLFCWTCAKDMYEGSHVADNLKTETSTVWPTFLDFSFRFRLIENFTSKTQKTLVVIERLTPWFVLDNGMHIWSGAGVYISQISAVTTHNISTARLNTIKTAGFPISVLKVTCSLQFINHFVAVVRCCQQFFALERFYSGVIYFWKNNYKYGFRLLKYAKHTENRLT